MGGSLGRSWPGEELGFRDGEGSPSLPTPLGDDGEKPLQMADVSSMGMKCYCGGEVVNREDHNSIRDRHG